MPARLHRTVGLVTVAIFALTGVYLRVTIPEGYEHEPLIRHLFRANHVYILMAGLVHVALGSHLRQAHSAGRRTLQRLGSWMLLAAPVILLTAFFVEPPRPTPERYVTAGGVFALALGTLCHLLAVTGRPSRGSGGP